MKIFISILLTFGLSNTVKADTIDFCHIYYNKLKIREFNQYSKGTIILKIKDIKKDDTITVFYFRDTPCSDCETEVDVENGQHVIITKGNGLGTFKPIKFSVNDLLIYQLKANKEDYEVFYFEKPLKSRSQRALIFRIKLE